MTVRELSELLDVTKNTINNKVRKLHIKPQLKGNRYELSDIDAQNIIKSIYPTNYQEFFDRANFGKADNAKSDNIINQDDKNDNQSDKSGDKSNQNDNNNAQYDNKTAQTINEKLISMLEQSLKDKEDTIKAQQKQIEMLLTTNAALTAKVTMLEDKSQEQKDIVAVSAPTPTEQKEEQEQQKVSWWKRLFN